MGVEGIVGVRDLAARMGTVPAELRAELRPKLRAAGTIVADQAKANASWSTRIPAAIGVRTSFGTRAGGVTIRVDSVKAPHARPYEGLSAGGGRGTFRHPVYGHDVWVTEATRPFLMPAVRAKRFQVILTVDQAIKSALRTLGGIRA
ncbi:MAG: HK97 gp10 family phage protein [Nocardioidaceae bacterium]